MEKDFLQSKTYLRHLQDLGKLEEEELAASAISPQAPLERQWRWGQVLNRLNQEVPHGQRQKMMKAIGEHFKKRTRQLFELQKFYQTFPEGLEQVPYHKQLTWSQIQAVLSLESEEERLFYLREAAVEGLSVRRIEAAVRRDLYQLVHKTRNKTHPHGELPRDVSPTFNYQARLIEVLDGDTLHLVAEQGFYSQYRLSVRLRGINTPELHGPEAAKARKAKQFLVDSLKDLDFVIIKTYKTDSFGRYIADVFYHPLWKDHLKIFQKGYFLNQQLLDEGLGKLAAY